MSDPEILRRFQYTDLSGNNNKFWLIKWWPDGTMTTEYGRVGDAGQSTTKKHVSRGGALAKIDEKLRKGYKEVDLARPVVVTAGVVADAATQRLIEIIQAEAGEQIQSFLAGTVDAISIEQIRKGRQLIDQAASTYGINYSLVELFYKTIPTQLPRRIDSKRVAIEFYDKLDEIEDRLNQLEAALAQLTTAQAGGNPLGNVTVEPLTGQAAGQIHDYVDRTSGGSKKIDSIFKVVIPNERSAWDASTLGKSAITALFHGTKSWNVRHILRSGLIIPRVAANGSRFGRGIYFADKSKRSLNYTGSRNYREQLMFVADVALGKPKKLSGDDTSLRAAPAGYDSVWGVQSYSGMDEFIIYRPEQQTIRALVVLK
jgi:poly [ADP-ribose] polymerase 2/3/4